MIEGVSHITLIVNNLEKTTLFFTGIFDAKEVYASGPNTFSLSQEKFFLVGGQWIAIMQGTAPPLQRSYHHIAFKISEQDLPAYQERITALQLECLPSRPRVPGEGQSLYFYDFDNHLFELHTGTLEERLSRYNQKDTL